MISASKKSDLIKSLKCNKDFIRWHEINCPRMQEDKKTCDGVNAMWLYPVKKIFWLRNCYDVYRMEENVIA